MYLYKPYVTPQYPSRANYKRLPTAIWQQRVVWQAKYRNSNAFVKDKEISSMKKRLSLLLIVVLLVVFVTTVFAACNKKDQLDEDVIKALDEYFEGYSWSLKLDMGKYDNATVVWVKSKAIENSLKTETIDDIQFHYDRRTLLLAVKEGVVYTMKEAFLDLVLNSSTLRAILEEYNKHLWIDFDDQYRELGKVIVLEDKVTMQDLGYVFEGTDLYYVEEDGTKTQYDYSDNSIVLLVDNNFSNHYFTIYDFRMVYYSRINFTTEHAYDQYNGNFPATFHHKIVIQIENSGKENVLNLIDRMLKLDFVMSAQVLTGTRIDETDDRLMEDGEYNAVLVAQLIAFSSWPTDYKVEIINNTLFIDGEEMGKLSLGQVSQENWHYPTIPDDLDIDYLFYVVEGVDLYALMTIEDCFVIDSTNSFWGANYFYLISSNNNYYLLSAIKVEEGSRIGKWIHRVYLLEEIRAGNEA